MTPPSGKLQMGIDKEICTKKAILNRVALSQSNKYKVLVRCMNRKR